MATVPAGRINKLFGTEGSVMLSLYDAFPEDFDPEQTPLLVTIDALEVPLWCKRFERRGVTGAVASFADLDTDRRAEELLGLEFEGLDTSKRLFLPEDMLETEGKGQILVKPLSELRETRENMEKE